MPHLRPAGPDPRVCPDLPAVRVLPNEETALRDLFGGLAGHGRLLVVVDQAASIGALAIAVARSMGVEVGSLPGLAMRRIAELLWRPGTVRGMSDVDCGCLRWAAGLRNRPGGPQGSPRPAHRSTRPTPGR